MTKGQELVLDLAEQLNTIKLPLMALKLDELYRSPDYPVMDKLDFLSALLAPEFRDKATKTTNNRLKKILGSDPFEGMLIIDYENVACAIGA